MATVESVNGPAWYDVKLAMTEFKKAHQVFCGIEIGMTSPARGFPDLWVRVVSWSGYKDGYRQHERAKGHQWPTREAKTMSALVYRLILELDNELTYAQSLAEQQSEF